MVPLQNTKPKITQHKIPKVKIFNQNSNFCKKSSSKFWTTQTKNYEYRSIQYLQN